MPMSSCALRHDVVQVGRWVAGWRLSCPLIVVIAQPLSVIAQTNATARIVRSCGRWTRDERGQTFGQRETAAPGRRDERVVLRASGRIWRAAADRPQQRVLLRVLRGDELHRGDLVAGGAQEQHAHRVGHVRGGLAAEMRRVPDRREGAGGAGLGERGPASRELGLAARRHGDQLGPARDAERDRIAGRGIAGVQREHGMHRRLERQRVERRGHEAHDLGEAGERGPALALRDHGGIAIHAEHGERVTASPRAVREEERQVRAPAAGVEEAERAVAAMQLGERRAQQPHDMIDLQELPDLAGRHRRVAMQEAECAQQEGRLGGQDRELLAMRELGGAGFRPVRAGEGGELSRPRIAAHRDKDTLARVTAVRTLGQFVEDEQIVTWLADNVAEINRAATRNAKHVGKQSLMQVSCTSCKVTKMCCYSLAIARLYEGVILAAELRRTGRDTPELREQLRSRAEDMEAASPFQWSTPCLFLDASERCTVYAARPSSCGTLLVYSPPELCVSRSREIQAYVPHQELAAASELEEMFRQRLALRQKVGRRYLGVLPRMALVALEAWDRTDFRDYLRQLPWPGDAELAKWSRNEAWTSPG